MYPWYVCRNLYFQFIILIHKQMSIQLKGENGKIKILINERDIFSRTKLLVADIYSMMMCGPFLLFDCILKGCEIEKK